jgi:hypothetical protein
MATAFVDAGAGFLTVSTSADCAPVAPAVVNPGDVLICHAFYGGSSAAPNTPSGYTLLDGPRDLSTPGTNGRVWVFGRFADGSEDGAAAAMGVQAVTSPRRGRIYRFSGALNDVITNVVLGFDGMTTGTTAAVGDDPVTTTGDDSLACQLVSVADDNAMGAFTGMSGGTWAEATNEFTSSTGTPDTCMQLQTASIASAGTIDGGSFTMSAADPWGVIGFYIKSPTVINLVVADVVQASVVDNVVLTQEHSLTVSDAVQASVVDNVVLTQVHELTVSDAVQASVVDNVVLTQEHSLTVSDVVQASVVDNVTLTIVIDLVVADVVQASVVDNVVLTQEHSLTVSDVVQASVVDNVVLTTGGAAGGSVYTRFGGQLLLVSLQGAVRIDGVPVAFGQ